MDLKLFDSHCHLYAPQFDADRAEVLARMRQEGTAAVLIGADLATSKLALGLAKQYDFLWASVGIHPTDNPAEAFGPEFEEMAQDPKVVAIGECGLEYSYGEITEEERARQFVRFEQQIELAQKVKKALVIHCRAPRGKETTKYNAHEDCSNILRNYGITKKVPVIIHFFTGTGELAQKYLDLGCYLSFPGPITYTDMYDESIRVTPLDKMLIETDAPYAAPVPNRGKRNEPVYVAHVAAKIAALKGLSKEEVLAATVQNAKKVFNLSTDTRLH
jgi:TatD DNase family protein